MRIFSLIILTEKNWLKEKRGTTITHTHTEIERWWISESFSIRIERMNRCKNNDSDNNKNETGSKIEHTYNHIIIRRVVCDSLLSNRVMAICFDYIHVKSMLSVSSKRRYRITQTEKEEKMKEKNVNNNNNNIEFDDFCRTLTDYVTWLQIRSFNIFNYFQLISRIFSYRFFVFVIHFRECFSREISSFFLVFYFSFRYSNVF